MLRELRTGLLYRNPKPHVRSEHAYFPSVVSDGPEWLATVVLGEAFEAQNLHTVLFRSTDCGEHWHLEGRLFPRAPGRCVSDCSRISRAANGELLVVTVLDDRSGRPDAGLANPENLGHVPNSLVLRRSSDQGRTWSDPTPIRSPLEGPCFELCCPIVVVRDDLWVLPTSTWPDWDGRAPNGWRMIALHSRNQGRSWDAATVMFDPEQRVIYWESKIAVLPDGRWLAVAWAYDRCSGRDLPNQFALSDDQGATWTPPRSMDIFGQTLAPLALPDGRVLCLVRRMDQPGLWAVLSEIEGERWRNLAFQPLWGAGPAGRTRTSENMVENFNTLRFGAPCLSWTPQGTIFAAFWGYEDCVSVIRWFNFRVE